MIFQKGILITQAYKKTSIRISKNFQHEKYVNVYLMKILYQQIILCLILWTT